MEPIASQFGSDNQSDSLFFEIFLKKDRNSIAILEKKDNKYELTFPGDVVVDAAEFLKLLQKGIKEL